MEKENILIIGDLHAPFIKEGYLEFCKSLQKKYKCNRTIFIGDIIDNHYSSFYESDPDGLSAIDELTIAKRQIKNWYKAFPVAEVCIGNHDRIIARKAFSGGLSQTWIKTIPEVLGIENWTFGESFISNDILYTHGEGQSAKKRATTDLISCVSGHYHTQAYIEYFVGLKVKLFAMQVGCGINFKSYAFAYGKHFKKQIISAGVILDNGKLPILELMDL